MKILFLAACLLTCASLVGAADLLDRIGLGQGTPTLTTALSTDEIASGLKQALSKGVEHAVSMLGTNDGFLKDVSVRIPMPESLKKVEKTLRNLGQEKLADEFVTTLNRAAETAVPEAAEVLAGAVRQMTLADARAILTATNNAATAYFRRTSETNLFTRFLPIVRKATEQAGVTSAYKTMVDKVSFGGFGASNVLGQNAGDLDGYVTHKALDGLFRKISEEEQRIRQSPAARSTELLQKVFGAVSKASSAPEKP